MAEILALTPPRNCYTGAALAWLLGLPAAAAGYLVIGHVPSALTMSALSGVMAGYYGYRARRWRRHRHEHRVHRVPAHELDQTIKHSQWLYLGRGFAWGSAHTNWAMDLEEQLSPTSPAPWLSELDANTPIGLRLDDLKGHLLLLGGTRSGKSTALAALIRQFVAQGHPTVVVDPKGSNVLRQAARRAAHAAGIGHKYYYFHPAFPESSVRINPIRNFNRLTQVADRIAALLPDDSAFSAFSATVLNHVLYGLWLAGERPTLVNIKHHLEMGTAQLVIDAIAGWCDRVRGNWLSEAKQYTANARSLDKRAAAMIDYYYAKVAGHNANGDLEGLLKMHSHNKEHFNKMTTSLFPILDSLTAGDLGPLLSPNPQDPDDTRVVADTARIIETGGILYVGLDAMSDTRAAHAVGSILTSDVTSVAGDRYNFGDTDRSVMIVLDEAAEVINDPVIQLLNKGGEAGFRLLLAAQTSSDIPARMDADKGEVVLGNIHNRATLRVQDERTKDVVTRDLPEVPRTELTTQYQRGVAVSRQPFFTGQERPPTLSNAERRQENKERVPAIGPALLGSLPTGHLLLRRLDGQLFYVRTPLVEERQTDVA